MPGTDTDSRSSAEQTLDLLLAAAAGNPTGFTTLCSEVKAWDEIFQAALMHGVEAYLYGRVMKAGIRLPAELGQRTDRWLIIRDVWQSHLEAALHDVLGILELAGVQAIALKGPLLGERVYPEPRHRPSADLDVMVGRNDLDKATNALAEIGYRPLNDSQERFLRTHHYHTILSRSCPPVVELHFCLSESFGVMIPAEDFLSRASLYRTARGTVTHVLAPEDELLYLAIHAAGHRFVRLSWLCDIQLLLGRHPDLDWTTVITRARKFHVLSPFLFTCDTLRRRLGATIPSFGKDMTQRFRYQIANLLLSVSARQPDPSRRSLISKMAFTAALCDRPNAAIGFIRRQFLLFMRRRAHRHFPSLTPEEWSY